MYRWFWIDNKNKPGSKIQALTSSNLFVRTVLLIVAGATHWSDSPCIAKIAAPSAADFALHIATITAFTAEVASVQKKLSSHSISPFHAAKINIYHTPQFVNMLLKRNLTNGLSLQPNANYGQPIYIHTISFSLLIHVRLFIAPNYLDPHILNIHRCHTAIGKLTNPLPLWSC